MHVKHKQGLKKVLQINMRWKTFFQWRKPITNHNYILFEVLFSALRCLSNDISTKIFNDNTIVYDSINLETSLLTSIVKGANISSGVLYPIEIKNCPTPEYGFIPNNCNITSTKSQIQNNKRTITTYSWINWFQKSVIR